MRALLRSKLPVITKEGHWVTLEGGTHVFLENGKVTEGPPDLTGRPIDRLADKKPSEEKPQEKPPSEESKPVASPSGEKVPSAAASKESLYKDHQVSTEVEKGVPPERVAIVLNHLDGVLNDMSDWEKEAIRRGRLSVKVRNGATVTNPTHGGKARAFYDKENGIIEVASKLINRDQPKPLIGKDHISNSLRVTISHEFGHAVSGRIALRALQNGVPLVGMELFNSKPKSYWAKTVSRYAGTNYRELMAEAYAAWKHPGYSKGKPLPPELVRVFEAAGVPKGKKKEEKAFSHSRLVNKGKGTCKPGQTAAQTHCTPTSGGESGQKPAAPHPNLSVKEVNRLIDNRSEGGPLQKQSDAEIVQHIRNGTPVGRALLSRIHRETEAREQWEERVLDESKKHTEDYINAYARGGKVLSRSGSYKVSLRQFREEERLKAEEKLELVRRGPTGRGIESWSRVPGGARMSGRYGESIGYDHIFASIKEAQKAGYAVLAGHVRGAGLMGEGEVLLIHMGRIQAGAGAVPDRLPESKSLFFFLKGIGTCKPGQRADLTHCTPASGEVRSRSGSVTAIEDKKPKDSGNKNPNEGQTQNTPQLSLQEMMDHLASQLKASRMQADYEQSFKEGKVQLDEGEIKAVNHYRSIDYRRVNGLLRKGEGGDDPVVVSLDAAMAKRITVQSGSVYRGVDHLPSVKVGDILSDKGFLSTSVYLNIAQNFNDAGTLGSVIQIDVPKGTHALWGDGQEHEVLLARGTRLRVVSVKDRLVKTEVVT